MSPGRPPSGGSGRLQETLRAPFVSVRHWFQEEAKVTPKKTSKTKSVQTESDGERYRAFVLVQTVPGRVEGVIRTLRRMPPVLTVDSVTGPYDIVALIEVAALRELSHVVAGTIGGLRGVTRTTTLLCT